MDVLSSLVPWLFFYGLIGGLVITYEKSKTKTDDSDPTYLGFAIFMHLPFLAGLTIMFLTNEGFWEVMIGIMLAWVTKDIIIYTFKYVFAVITKKHPHLNPETDKAGKQ